MNFESFDGESVEGRAKLMGLTYAGVVPAPRFIPA
jgi:hypothetical protein